MSIPHSLHEKLEILLDFFVLCFEDDVIDDDKHNADNHTSQFAFGDGVGAEQGHHENEEG